MKNIVENQCIKTDKPLPMSYEALKAERDALAQRVEVLAVENAALNEMNSSLCAELREYESDDCQFGPMPQSVVNCFALHTPATSAALAAIQAQGVEKAAEALDALSAQSASATTQANFRAAAVYLRAAVLPAIGEAK
ncbi:hypothetical protein ACTVKS_15345 [Serratia bockelmannii]|uniref:hypothetical protein n=1 Tax=Serratia bockelmannii TaxID=2703793 RepID=UPI003FA6E3F4